MTPRELLEKIDKDGWYNYLTDNDLFKDTIELDLFSTKNVLIEESRLAMTLWQQFQDTINKFYDVLEKEVYHVR